MGLFCDHFMLEYEGNMIEVEVRATAFWAQYDLIINNARRDRIGGFLGTFFLHGELPLNDGATQQVKVEIRQTMFRTRYFLCAGNDRITMQKA